MIKLYGFAPTRSIRVLWTLRELDVDFEFITVNLLAGDNQRSEFLKLNPAGKIPVLVDGDNRWLLFAATELEQPLWRIARHTMIYPEDKRLPDEVSLARQDFQSMAAVLDEHMKGRQFVAGPSVTVADLVMAYTLDWANEVQLLEAVPGLRGYMERMYQRPKAPPRIAAALASIQT